ncbi:uncharacterized protein LOC123685500 isoform X2 [Harmonia axyridis]|uniref:uncharacterized protein LOC123685500 isoform X2 n=1 Tax=Harmonia axyridis TaxID=115357 RepID=UPI001E275C48|nr:uncharacterized protein LOC123685500 isoform X2 [Harmonia axyridis]
MDKWHNQFDQLRKQWSKYNSIDSDYRPHDKRQIAKIGVAWVVKLPGEHFRQPVGWEVEIIDTPLGISEKSNNLLKWLRHPPSSTYDNISQINDSSKINLYNSFYDSDSSYKNNYDHPDYFNVSHQRFSVPPNEHEIFKKTCCECKEKSFKNSATDYESDVKTSRPKQVISSKLNTQSSNFNQPLENGKSKTNKTSSSLAKHSIYDDFEEELNSQIFDATTQSSIDQINKFSRSSRSSTPKKHRRRSSRGKTSNLTNRSVETSQVLSDMQSIKEPSSLINEGRHSVRDEIINGTNSPISFHRSSGIPGDIKNETIVTSTPHRNSGPHVPSVDIFDDNIFSRGTSLEQYRNTDTSRQSRVNKSEYRSPSSKSYRDNHRHHHRRSRSKEVSMDAEIEDNRIPSKYKSSALENEQNTL